jgi:hypothetical protein
MNLDAALDAAYTTHKIKRGPRCTMGAVLEALPEATRDKLVHVLMSPKADGQMVSTSVISEVLQDAGYPVKPAAILRHRRRLWGQSNGCVCDVG